MEIVAPHYRGFARTTDVVLVPVAFMERLRELLGAVDLKEAEVDQDASLEVGECEG